MRKLSGEEFLEYMTEVIKRERHPNLRVGQHYYNVLHCLHRDIANAIIGTDIDPFYDSTKLNAFLNGIIEHANS